MNDARLIESPDSLELLRTRCPRYSYQFAIAVWCRDPACCNQSPWGFLVEELASAQAARSIPVFAVRYPAPLPPYSPDIPVRVWRAGNLKPVFEGRLEDAASAWSFAAAKARPTCSPAMRPTRRGCTPTRT